MTIPMRAPYETEFRVVVNRTQFGQIVPGMVLPVKVDADDPSRVAIDPSRGAQVTPGHGTAMPAGGMQIPGLPPGVQIPGMSGAGAASIRGQPVAQILSAAEIVAQGVPTTGIIQSAAPTGMTAGQFAADLAPHEANDPLVLIAFSYRGPGGEEMHTQAVFRVPDGKGARMTPGTDIAVGYLPDQPTVATVDRAGT